MLIFNYHFVVIALIICLILTGIHTYLGYHVVKRGVIFVDLSLSQVAALGSSVGVLLGFGHEFPIQNYIISLLFTILGALLFVLFRSKKEKVPIEALIGITYAAAIALSLIILEHSATGTEEIKEMLSGSLLTVSPKEFTFILVLYSVIGIIHFFTRKQLLLITEKPEEARRKGMNIWIWDLLFYITFGFIVTSSVKVAGVLLVFAFLIIPAVASMLLFEKTINRIISGWLFGIIGCTIGLEVSLRIDSSAAPSIIIVFLIMLILIWIISIFLKKNYI